MAVNSKQAACKHLQAACLRVRVKNENVYAVMRGVVWWA